jgi:murein DD-endopeptidase MepM/ murein hydrolase activator NlpD
LIKYDLASGFKATSELLRRHPRRITSALAILLLGTGVTAFGLAPLAPDASDLPVQQVQESVQSLPTQTQTDALADFRFKLFRTESTRGSDTADTLLKRLNIDDAAAASFLRNDDSGRLILLGRPGKNVTAEASDNNQLLKLTVRWPSDDEDKFTRLVVERATDKNTFTSRLETAAYTRSSQLNGGIIHTSLFASTDDSNIPDAIAIQIAEIFSGDIDFQRSLRQGDRFSVVYETLEADGEALRTGKVLSAEFINKGKTLQAMWFNEPPVGKATATKGGYYTLEGQSLRRAYLTSPMEFSRISSTFKMRFHPILKVWRRHEGTDYAGRTGTPVRSVGDGVVEFAGRQTGYGNVVFIKHRNNNTTVYAHLSRISVKRGQSVDQGQNVGAVGSTGWATGPHLHFEFRVNGVPKDPVTIAQQSETIPLATSAMPLFRKQARGVAQQLQAASTMIQARAE